jgi:hypothetical protein
MADPFIQFADLFYQDALQGTEEPFYSQERIKEDLRNLPRHGGREAQSGRHLLLAGGVVCHNGVRERSDKGLSCRRRGLCLTLVGVLLVLGHDSR